MEIDHIFVFSPPKANVADELVENGFKESTPNQHIGQGTANRRFLFNGFMLEFIWMSHEEEIRSPPIEPSRLWERSQWKTSGFSPFGLCVRETPNDPKNSVLQHCFDFQPPYLPNGCSISVCDNLAFPLEPMLFATPFPKSRIQPNFKSQHSNQVCTCSGITLQSQQKPESVDFNRLVNQQVVNWQHSEELCMDIEFDHHIQCKTLDLRPNLPLVIRF